MKILLSASGFNDHNALHAMILIIVMAYLSGLFLAETIVQKVLSGRCANAYVVYHAAISLSVERGDIVYSSAAV